MFRGVSSSNSKQKKSKHLDEAAVEELFNSFADVEDSDIMTLEGISKFGELLNIDASTDVKILMILFRLGALSKPGSITRKEFENGMVNVLRVDSVEGLRALLPSFDPGFLDTREFRDFHHFVFQFSREGTHKTLEKDAVASLLPLVLDVHRAPHLPYFLEFLSSPTASSYQRITLV
jgi:hypothetical protein